MELFVPERCSEEILLIMSDLRDLGVGGRDAAYLASINPPEVEGTPEMAMYLKEFKLMVHRSARSRAADLLGISAGGMD